MATGDKLIQVKDLKKYFPIKGGLLSKTIGHVKAVDGVTFNLKRGCTMGLWVRQVHVPPQPEPAGGAHRRLHHLQWGGYHKKEDKKCGGQNGKGGHRPAPPEDGHGVPALQPVPSHDHHGQHDSSPHPGEAHGPGRGGEKGPGPVGPSRPAGPCPRLSHPALRRPEAADCHCPGIDDGAGGYAL